MARIAIGGIHHESNSFSSRRTTWESFLTPSGWPALVFGDALFDRLPPLNIAAGGFIKRASSLGHLLVPTLWANACSGAPVEAGAFERLAAHVVAELSIAGPVDAVFLDLSGALRLEGGGSGDEELLRRVRSVVGPDVPIVLALDLHANLSRRLLQLCDGLVSYRSYPHTDAAETGERAAILLDRILERGPPSARALLPLGFPLPLHAQGTRTGAAGTLLRQTKAVEAMTGLWALTLCFGFPGSGSEPTVAAFGEDFGIIERALRAVHHSAQTLRPHFQQLAVAPVAAVAEAMRRLRAGAVPVMMAEASDNPGAGGSGQSVSLLAALLEAGAPGVVFGILIAPDIAARAAEAGLGRQIGVGLRPHDARRHDARNDAPHDPGAAYSVTATVRALADGKVLGSAGILAGCALDYGTCALLEIGKAQVIVASRPVQAGDPGILDLLGVDMARARILALKSSVLNGRTPQDQPIIVSSGGGVPTDCSTMGDQPSDAIDMPVVSTANGQYAGSGTISRAAE